MGSKPRGGVGSKPRGVGSKTRGRGFKTEGAWVQNRGGRGFKTEGAYYPQKGTAQAPVGVPRCVRSMLMGEEELVIALTNYMDLIGLVDAPLESAPV